MKGCDKLVDVGRRQFLRGGALATAGVAAATVLPARPQAKPMPARVDYPSNRLANVSRAQAQRADGRRLSGQGRAGRPDQARHARAGRRRARRRHRRLLDALSAQGLSAQLHTPTTRP